MVIRMPELSVVIVANDNEQRAVLQVLVDGTTVARTVHTCASFPVAASDPVTRRVHAATPDVTLVDIPADNPSPALRAIELLHQEMPDATRNLHRMDASLLESFMIRHSGGLHLLAGSNVPAAVDPSTAEFVRLFDMLMSHYRYIVVDASSRFDPTSRVIASLSETVLL